MNKLKMILVLAMLLCFTTLFTATAQTICDNDTGTQGGYTYEYWKDSGSGCMTLGSGGNFSVEWSNINNLLARKGLRPGGTNVIVDYSCSYNPNGNSYMCVYGWTRNPLVEYYIVDSWGSWRPPGGEGHQGTTSSDGGSYDIYKTMRYDQPSIDGTQTFPQYWSVRTSKKTSGTITCGTHFSAWGSHGMNMGSFYEVSFCIEGYQSSGNASVTMSMSTGTNPTPETTPESTPSPSPNTTGNIVVRARGTMGGENMEVRVGGNVVGSWTMTTSYQDYYADGSGTIDVYFTNDDQLENGMDIQVDYITVDGITYQAEDQETNTGVYVDSQCGGSYSEWLHCDGYIRFITETTTPDPTVTPTPVTGTATPTPPVGDCNVSFDPGTSTQGVNSTFTVNIDVDSGSQNLAAYGFTINYDENILSVVDVEEGADGFLAAANTSTPGEIKATGFEASGVGPGSNLEILTITFEAIAEGTSTLTLGVDQLVDSDVIQVGTACGINGSIEVSSVVLGDVNEDGSIDVIDALLVAQYYVNLVPANFNPAAADTNCDGSIDIVDALLIAQYYVGLVPGFCL